MKDEESELTSAERLEDVRHAMDEVQALQRIVEKERMARQEAERTFKKSYEELNAANRALDKSNSKLQETILELNDTMVRLTSHEVKSVATKVTVVVAMVLFIISEFTLEPVLEESIGNVALLQLAKLAIFSLLIPLEIIASRIIEADMVNSDVINQNMYERLLHSAYDDGIITDLERTLLTSSATELGITPEKAMELEKAVREKLNVDEEA